MRKPASTPLKLAYSIVLLSAVAPGLLALIGLFLPPWNLSLTSDAWEIHFAFVIQMLPPVLGLYRIYLVIRVPGTLASYPAIGFTGILHRLGVFSLYVGMAVAAITLAEGLQWALRLIVGDTESGAGFFGFAQYLTILGKLGLFGLLLFELSRIVGFEKYAEQHDAQ